MTIRCALCGLVLLALAGCAATPPPRPSSAKPQAPAPAASSASSPFFAKAAPSAAPPAAPRPKAVGTAEDARKHMIRGMAAIEIAKTPGDLQLAEDEFRMATEISPEMANAWYNLGSVQTRLERYGEAIASYRRYLELAPEAEDARKVRDDLVKLEFRQEVAAKVKGRIGLWVGRDGAPYNLTLDGNNLTLKTARRRVPEDEVRASYTLVGSFPITGFIPSQYQLALQGTRLTGSWTRGPVSADKCQVPPETAEVTGELLDAEKKMILRYEKTSYHAAIQMSLLGDDFCKGVSAERKKKEEAVLYGPLPKGGLGVGLYGLTEWWDGGLSVIDFGWQGRLKVYPAQGSPAHEVGIQSEDEILAIDGVALNTLSAGEAVMRLRGEPGSTVMLELWRKSTNETFLVTVRRVELPPANAEDPSSSWYN